MLNINQEMWNRDWKYKPTFIITKNDGDEMLHVSGKYQIIEVLNPDKQAYTTFGGRFVRESKKKNPRPVYFGGFHVCDSSDQIQSTIEDKTIRDVNCEECKMYLESLILQISVN